MAISACASAPMRAEVTIALAPMRPSASIISRSRQSNGSSAAIMPARSTPSRAMTLSTVLASCIATTVSVCSPRPRSLAASADIAWSASA